ncbi:hypothetical protein E4U56_005837 [Claviceps arundinis]|uniref:Uncharacterized protein n=1 Tax=Claviceps arundinis TaxID=1623583 RepID=A0A9P7MXM5_9HYPO|nr:hypothetical protein E4U56_005837 [Claviceps arundinis]
MSSPSSNSTSTEAAYPPCPRGGLATCSRCLRTLAKDAMARHMAVHRCQERLARQDKRLDKPRGPDKLVRCPRCMRNFKLHAIEEHLESHKPINTRK